MAHTAGRGVAHSSRTHAGVLKSDPLPGRGWTYPHSSGSAKGVASSTCIVGSHGADNEACVREDCSHTGTATSPGGAHMPTQHAGMALPGTVRAPTHAALIAAASSTEAEVANSPPM